MWSNKNYRNRLTQVEVVVSKTWCIIATRCARCVQSSVTSSKLGGVKCRLYVDGRAYDGARAGTQQVRDVRAATGRVQGKSLIYDVVQCHGATDTETPPG